MDIILSQNEKQLKQWAFTDKNNGLVFDNNIVITDKRFIYQKELSSAITQKSVNRCDVPVQNIKAINSFYGATQNLLWLILGIVGIGLFLFGVLMMIKEEIGAGIFMLIVGLILGIVGFIFHFFPEKSPIKTIKPSFIIELETKTPMGSQYCVEAGGRGVLKGKKKYNPLILIALLMFGVVPGIIYYIIKNKNNADGIEIPEKEVIEIIETLGALIF